MPRRFLAFSPRTYGPYGFYKRRGAYMTMREITTGNGGLDRMRGGGRDGRGNLRENREDPAPTVGRLRGGHCAQHRAQRPPIDATMRVPCHPTCLPPMEPLWFLQRRGTLRRYGLRIIASA